MRLRRPSRRTSFAIAALLGLLLLVWGWDCIVGNTFFSFHGRVVSIDGSPIAGATVTVDVVAYKFFQIPFLWKTMYGTTRSVTLTTNADGDFFLHKTHGKSITIGTITKAGFDQSYNSGERWSFVFSGPAIEAGTAHVPTYILVPLGPSAGNVEGSMTVRPKRDGQPHLINLLAGRADTGEQAGAQLRITVNGPVNLRVKPPQRFNWSVSIAGIELGLCETQDVAPQRAPSEGYRPDYSLVSVPKQPDWNQPDPGWATDFKRRFYLRSNDGRFRGWCELTASPISPGIEDTADITLTYVYNTQGSENLYRPRRGK